MNLCQIMHSALHMEDLWNLTSKVRFMFLLLQSVITRFLPGHLTSLCKIWTRILLTTLLLRTGGKDWIWYWQINVLCQLPDCYTEYTVVSWLLVLYQCPPKWLMDSTSSVIDAKVLGNFLLRKEKICFLIRTNNIIIYNNVIKKYTFPP